MGFHENAYPLRFDRFRFPEHLFDHIGAHFTRIVAPRSSFVEGLVARGENPEETIGGQRCPTEAYGFLRLQVRRRCDFAPQSVDRAVLRSLLRAWIRRGVSGIYLDFVLVRRLENSAYERPQSVEEARERIRQTYPEGCVRFAYDELPRQCQPGDLPIFGDAIRADASYNEVYSAILMWDDMYCSGIVPWVQSETSRLAHDGSERGISVVVRAAYEWVSAAQRIPGSIYQPADARRRDLLLLRSR